MLSPKIRIGDRDFTYVGPEHSELTYATCLYAIWNEIGLCLEYWMEVDLGERRRNQAAGLIFNPVTHPMWTNIGKGYGTGLTKSVVRTLKASQKSLLKAEKCAAKDPLQAESFRRSATTALGRLPSPLNFIMQSARRDGEEEVLRTIGFMMPLLQEYLNEPTHRGNDRAHWTALCVRAIFEEYTDIPITSGRMEQVPSGIFCNCLEQVNTIVAPNCDFRHFADLAQGTAFDDNTLMKVRTALTLDLSEQEIKNIRSFSD